jgi:hypothetical protein
MPSTNPAALEFPEGFQKAHLASEIASDLVDLKDILERHQITNAHLQVLTQQTEFNQMLEEFTRDWKHPMNVKERIRLKAALAIEDGLSDMYHIFRNTDLAPAARLDAYKQLVTLSDTAPRREAEGAAGSGFSIVINVGKTGEGDIAPVVIEGQAIETVEAIEV